MTQLRPVDRWEWLDLVRRARLGRTTKAVALMLATYANDDGSRVFPGIARLAVVCELGYNTVKRTLGALRDEGWIEPVAKAGARGRGTQYRLTVRDGEDIPTPAQIEVAIERLRAEHGRGNKPRRPTAEADVLTGRQPTGEADVPVDNSERQPTARADVDEGPTDTSAHGVTRTRGTSATLTTTRRPAPRPPTNQGHVPLTPTSHGHAPVAANGTSARDNAAEDPISDDGGRQSPTLRLVAELPSIPEEPRSATDAGNGFCIACYRDGQTVVAADPINGSACNHHLASLETA